MDERGRQVAESGTGGGSPPRHVHICCPYVDVLQKRAISVDFVVDGLRRAERVICADEPAALAELTAQVAVAGFDVARLEERGALVLLGHDRVIREHGRFDVAAFAGLVKASAASARADGYPGCRGLSAPPPLDEPEQQAFARYEAATDEFVRRVGVGALCFHRRDTAAGFLDDVLRTHPLVLLDGERCENLFYAPPLLALARAGDDARVAWMLGEIALRARSRARAEATRVAEAMTRYEAARGRQVQALAKAVEARDALVGSLARRLRPPLPELRALLDDLEAEAMGTAGRDTVDRVREQIDRIDRLVMQTEEIAAFTGAELTLTPEHLDMVALVKRACATWKNAAAHASATLRIEAEEGPLEGRWDVRRATDLVDRLLGLAFDHGWGTPIEIGLEARGEVVRLTFRFRAMESVCLDDPETPGAGTRAAYDRLGVEIWVSRELARMMGGTVGLSIWPDARVTVTVELPRAIDAARDEAAPA